MPTNTPQQPLVEKVDAGINKFATKSRINRALTVIGLSLVAGILLLSGMPDKAEQAFDKAQAVSTAPVETPPAAPTVNELLPAPVTE